MLQTSPNYRAINLRYKETKMRVLITGAGGFVGRYLADYCLSMGAEVYGLERAESNVQGVKVYHCDITDADTVADVIADLKPENIYHLAAVSFVPEAGKNPGLACDINFRGTLNLYEAVRKTGVDSKMLFVSTSEVYGKVPHNDIPVKEETPLNPSNIYAVSKAAAEILSRYYISVGLPIITVRPFNHTGPGQNPSFVCSDFARQIVTIERGEREPIIEVGNLDAKRDFTDVRDVIMAYWMLMNSDKGVGEVFNICSGRVISIKEILDFLVSKSKVEIKVTQNTKRMRMSDMPILYGKNEKLRSIIEWEASIPIEATLGDMLEYWRRQ